MGIWGPIGGYMGLIGRCMGPYWWVYGGPMSGYMGAIGGNGK